MLGFSAGGHLTALAATNFDKRGYEPADAADKESCRPDFAIMIYPGGVVGRNGEINPGVRVTKETPPSFFAHAGDDRVTPENSVKMYLALKRAGVPAELHVYAAGGHGFGMRPGKLPVNTWTKRCEEWLRAQKIIPPAGGAAGSTK
jgi:acetyl esterase/lipase